MAKSIKKKRSGWIFLFLVVLTYLILFATGSDEVDKALYESYKILKMIAPLILVVFFIMSFINSFIDAKSVAKHLGDDSGIKGYAIALTGGVLSTGPGYIWYPLLQELREKGAKDGLVMAFVYARAVKIPWLPVMISYFGVKFTLVFSLYIILAALFQGVVVDKLKL